MEKKNLEIQRVTDLLQAEHIWKQLSPEETIYDSWEFRALFQKYHQKEIRFYVGFVDGVMIGVLPLQYNADKGWIEFFGGDYMEDNRLFIASGYENYRQDFYEYLKTLGEKIKLEYIRAEDDFTKTFEVADQKWVLPLTGFQSYTDFLEDSFEGKTKNTFYRKIKKIEQNQIEIQRNNFDDLELLFEYNKLMFGDHSSFNDRPFHQEIFRDLVKIPEFTPEILTFLINGEKEAISFSLQYKGWYEFFLFGLRPDKIKDLSTFINVQNIQRAIDTKANYFDAFVGAYGWKDRWHFTPIAQYKFTFGF